MDPKRAKVHDLVVAAELMDNGKDDINNPLLGERFFIQVISCVVGWVCEIKQKKINKHTSAFTMEPCGEGGEGGEWAEGDRESVG